MKSRARRGSPLPPAARWPHVFYGSRRWNKRRKTHWRRWGVADLPRTEAKRRAVEEDL